MPRPGPTSTAARSIPSSRCAATASRPGVLAAACADARDRPAGRLDQRGLRRRRGPTGRPWQPTDPTAPGNPYGASKLEGERLRGRGVRRATGRRARDRPHGLAVRVAGARLPEPHPRGRRAGPGRRRAAPRGRRRVGDPDLHGRRRRRDRRAPRGRRRSPGSTTSSTACSRPAPTGLAMSSRGPASRSRSSNVPVLDLGAAVAPAALGRPGGDAAAVRRAAARRGPTRWPTTRPRSCARPGPGVTRRPRQPPRRPCRASATAPSPAMPTTRGSFRELWRAGRLPRPSRSSRPTCRPRRPASCAASTSIAARTTSGSSPTAGPSSRSSTSGRCSTAADRAARRDARAPARRVGRHPDRGRARVPRARAAPARLPRDQRVRRLRRARLRLGRPGGRGRLAGRSPEPPTDGRSCRSVTRRTRRWPSSLVRLRRHRGLNPDPHQSTRLPTAPRPEGASASRDHPAIERAALGDEADEAHPQPRPASESTLAQDRRRPRPRPARQPRHRSCRPLSAAAGDPKVVIIVGATHGATAELPRGRRPGVRRGDQVHLERRQGLQPERDLVEGQGGGRRGIGGHLHGPRQRLAEPVHLRPELHDQGRLRAQRHGRGRATTTTSTTASRTSRRSTSRRARSSCSTTCATRRATPSRATPSRASRSPASAPTTTPPGSSRPAPRRSSPTGTPAPRRYLRGLFTTHQSIEDMWRDHAERERQRRPASRRCGRPACTVFQDPETPTSGFYRSLAIGTVGVTTDEVVSGRLRRHGCRPDRASSSPATPRSRPRAPACTATSTRRCRPAATCRPGPGCASSTSRARRPPRGRRWSRSRASTTRRSPASWSPSTSRRATARRPSSASLDAGRAASRRTATGRSTRRPSAGASPNRSPGRSACATPTTTWSFETTGTGATFEAAWDGLVGGDPVADGTYTVERQRRRRLGQRAGRATRSVRVDTDAPRSTGLTPGADTTPVVLAERRRLPRHGRLTATNSETGHAHRPRPSTPAARGQDAGRVANGTAAATRHLERRDQCRRLRARRHLHASSVAPRDLAGNSGDGRRPDGRPGRRALRSVATSSSRSSSRRTSTPGHAAPRCRSRLARPMTVTWTLRDASRRSRSSPGSPTLALPAGTQPGRSTAADRRADAAARSLHLVRDRDRRDADRDADVTRSTSTPSHQAERHHAGARPVDHGHGHLGRDAGEARRALFITSPASPPGASG